VALPLTGAGLGDPYLALRKFYTFAVEYGRRERFSPTLRSVLRAVVWMGQVTGRHTVSSGCRTLAEQAGCHADTVASGLHELAAHGLVTRLREGTGTEADLWLLRVRLGEEHRPVRGSIHGLHHVFRVIGGHDTAEVYDELARAVGPVTAKAMASRLGYPSSRIHEQLRLLAGWQLAERSIDGWTVGPADIEALGRRLGGYDAWQAQHDRHVEERRRWHEYLLGRGQLPQLAGQIAWDDEFAVVADDQDAWIQDLAGGSPPVPSLDDAVRLARHTLGGVVIA
jgi:hypothetical protein